MTKILFIGGPYHGRHLLMPDDVGSIRTLTTNQGGSLTDVSYSKRHILIDGTFHNYFNSLPDGKDYFDKIVQAFRDHPEPLP